MPNNKKSPKITGNTDVPDLPPMNGKAASFTTKSRDVLTLVKCFCLKGLKSGRHLCPTLYLDIVTELDRVKSTDTHQKIRAIANSHYGKGSNDPQGFRDILSILNTVQASVAPSGGSPASGS